MAFKKLIALMTVSSILAGCASVRWDSPLAVPKETQRLASQLKNQRVYFETSDQASDQIPPPLLQMLTDVHAKVVPISEAQRNDIRISYSWSPRQLVRSNSPMIDDGFPGMSIWLMIFSAGLFPSYENRQLTLSVNVSKNGKSLFKNEYSTQATIFRGWVFLPFMAISNGNNIDNSMGEVLESRFIKDIESEDVL